MYIIIGKYFILIIAIIYFNWFIFTVLKFNDLNKWSIYISDEKLNEVTSKIYTNIISFEKSKNFTQTLQKNLQYQINDIDILEIEELSLWKKYFDCIKDMVDLNDMTFDVGNDDVNMILRKKGRECYCKKILLDVVADLREVAVDKKYLCYILSNLINNGVKYIKKAKKKEDKVKILIRGSKSNHKSNNFFILQLTYNVLNNIKENTDTYQDASLNLILNKCNGILLKEEKNQKYINTVTIALKD